MGGGVLSDGWIGQVGLVQSVTFGKILTQINIRIYLYQKISRMNIRIYLYQKMLRILYERIFVSENI